MKDPRKNPNDCARKLNDILMIAICTIMCGGESWEDMAFYGQEKYDWLKTFLELPNGIPSHDTFYRVFCLLDPEAFQACFVRWVKSAFPDALPEDSKTDIVPIDGKRSKAPEAKVKASVPCIWSVPGVIGWAWYWGRQKWIPSPMKSQLSLSCLRLLTSKAPLSPLMRSAVRRVLRQRVSNKGPTTCLVVKGNQETLQKDIQVAVEEHWEQHPTDEPSGTFAEQENTGHGRREYRCCWVFDDPGLLSTHEEWQGLKQFGVVQADRTINGKATTALRFYISSRSMTALDMLYATRTHWEVENNLHWMLDVSFSEDACQTKHENGAENMAWFKSSEHFCVCSRLQMRQI